MRLAVGRDFQTADSARECEADDVVDDVVFANHAIGHGPAAHALCRGGLPALGVEAAGNTGLAGLRHRTEHGLAKPQRQGGENLRCGQDRLTCLVQAHELGREGGRAEQAQAAQAGPGSVLQHMTARDGCVSHAQK